MSFAWFLAQLKPNAIRIAERNLARQNFQTFLPLIEQTSRKTDRFVRAEKPLFPGYIFVRFDTEVGGWRAINNTQGITKLVSFGSTPAPVPDALIAELQARATPGGLIQPDLQVAVGDTVQVTHGPFADFIAEVTQVDENQRVWLLIDLMGRQTRLAVTPQDIRPKD